MNNKTIIQKDVLKQYYQGFSIFLDYKCFLKILRPENYVYYKDFINNNLLIVYYYHNIKKDYHVLNNKDYKTNNNRKQKLFPNALINKIQLNNKDKSSYKTVFFYKDLESAQKEHNNDQCLILKWIE